MGTWAEGNFDDDGALDYVGEVVDGLVQRVNEILNDEDRRALDEEGEAVLMPSVAIISLLCEHCKAAPPEEKAVRIWRNYYLKVFDEQIDDLLIEPESDHKGKRRKVIEETFARLEQQAREFWKT